MPGHVIPDRDWRIYQQAFRDPTMRDVEDRAEEIGAEFWKTTATEPSGARVRTYWLKQPGVSAPEVLQRVRAGVRPDWGQMLKRMEADWI